MKKFLLTLFNNVSVTESGRYRVVVYKLEQARAKEL